VVEESMRRKVAGMETANTSAVTREALAGFFARHTENLLFLGKRNTKWLNPA
jgi:hypothetical protein